MVECCSGVIELHKSVFWYICFTYFTLQLQKSKNTSSLEIYKSLAKLRQNPAFTNKKIVFSTVNEDIISYVRGDTGHLRYLVVLNFGSRDSSVNCSGIPVGTSHGEVVLSADSSITGSSTYKVGDKTDLQKIHLKSGEGLIIKIWKNHVIIFLSAIYT